jgi:membrane fusion protein (multidrug efflux system)
LNSALFIKDRFVRVAWIRLNLGAVIAIAALTLSGCKKKEPPPPPFEVGVVTVHPQSVAVHTDLPGRISAFLVAEVHARVDGIVQRREFVEGSQVKAGQNLYLIDPAPYRAALDSALATLGSTRAKAERFEILRAQNAIAPQDADDAKAAYLLAKANVDTARINLGYTDVTSPITGTIGASSVTPGAYVQASAATLMAMVQKTDPVYIDVTQSTVDLLRLRRELADGKLQSAGPNEAKVTLTLEDSSTYPLDGKIEFTDITVNQTTGSVTLRAIFPNPNQVLLPGMFVHATLDEGINNRAMLVPEVGVTHDAKGMPTALIVGVGNKVEQRNLTASRTEGANWVVEGGLEPGAKVIISGLQKVQLGMTVKSVEQKPTPSIGQAR